MRQPTAAAHKSSPWQQPATQTGQDLQQQQKEDQSHSRSRIKATAAQISSPQQAAYGSHRPHRQVKIGIYSPQQQPTAAAKAGSNPQAEAVEWPTARSGPQRPTVTAHIAAAAAIDLGSFY